MRIKGYKPWDPKVVFANLINEILIQVYPDAPASEENRLVRLIAAAEQSEDQNWEQCYDVFQIMKLTKVSELLKLMIDSGVDMGEVYMYLQSLTNIICIHDIKK